MTPDTVPDGTMVECQAGTPILRDGWRFENGAAHEPANSPADFIGSVWFCDPVRDIDHSEAVAHPDLGDQPAAAPELTSPDFNTADGAAGRRRCVARRGRLNFCANLDY